jgi:hypothetical protein
MKLKYICRIKLYGEIFVTWNRLHLFICIVLPCNFIQHMYFSFISVHVQLTITTISFINHLHKDSQFWPKHVVGVSYIFKLLSLHCCAVVGINILNPWYRVNLREADSREVHHKFLCLLVHKFITRFRN